MDDSLAFGLGVGESIPFHWPFGTRKQLVIKLAQEWSWSGGFRIDEILDVAIKIPHLTRDLSYFARVQVRWEHNTFFVIFNNENKEYSPYRIENQLL